ncbi:MAG: phospholipase D-like domain-containing protein [Pseudonocardiaceae bacterium]
MRARWGVPAALGAGAAWYATNALRHHRAGRRGYELRGEDLDVGSEEFLRATEALTNAPISRGNDVELLVNGDAIFPAFLETIEAAQRSLNLLTFVYWRGEIAHGVAGALAERAAAGVAVNVLLDAVGTAKMEPQLITRMREAGVTVARFRPPRLHTLGRWNNRTHRKVMVADGELGMIGGVGIAEEWTGRAQDPEHWRDTHLRVRGPVVRGLQGAFGENWLEATGDVLVGPAFLPELTGRGGGGPMQLVRSSAGVGDTNVEALYFLAIASASRSIDLTAGYFAPRRAFVDILAQASRRGVRVRVLVPGEHIDKEFVRIAGRAVYDELLAAGVRIWEYGPTMLHAKTMTVDGAWASVGSVNFDNRSFQLHDEATLCVQSQAFVDQLTHQFERDLAVSDEIDDGRWQGRPWHHHAREQTLRLVRREL